MARVLLTDSDRFPFGASDLQLLDEAEVTLDELSGHDRGAYPATLTPACSGCWTAAGYSRAAASG